MHEVCVIILVILGGLLHICAMIKIANAIKIGNSTKNNICPSCPHHEQTTPGGQVIPGRGGWRQRVLESEAYVPLNHAHG